jgi:hypothetical protein
MPAAVPELVYGAHSKCAAPLERVGSSPTRRMTAQLRRATKDVAGSRHVLPVICVVPRASVGELNVPLTRTVAADEPAGWPSKAKTPVGAIRIDGSMSWPAHVVWSVKPTIAVPLLETWKRPPGRT